MIAVKPYDSQGSGRTVLASTEHQNMLGGFKSMSTEASSQGYHALAITNAINSLRGNASPVNSFSKDGSPTRRCIVFSGFEIEYELNNFHGGPQTDVEIIDIRMLGQHSNKVKRAALWEVNANDNKRWETADQPTSSLGSTLSRSGLSENQAIKVGINGYSDDLEHAAGMLPSHIARGEQDKLDALQQSGYQLFYVPQSGSAIKAGWSFIRDLGRREASPQIQQASRILANHMKEAHDQGLHIEWTSQRGGSKVLTEAMKLLARKQINLEGKQKIFLSDHTSSHYEADVARRAVGMDTRASKWHNSTKGIAQIAGGQTFGTANMACSINELINHTKREEIGGKVFTVGVAATALGTGAVKMGPEIAKLVAEYAISPAYAAMVWKAIGAVAITSSVPSLNEGYSSGATSSVQNLMNKSVNRFLPKK